MDLGRDFDTRYCSDMIRLSYHTGKLNRRESYADVMKRTAAESCIMRKYISNVFEKTGSNMEYIRPAQDVAQIQLPSTVPCAWNKCPILQNEGTE